MSKTATIQTRVDPEVKKEAKKILKKLGITMSEAISMYLSQIAMQRGVPFELKVPKDLTARTLLESEDGKKLHSVSSSDKLFLELEG